MPEPTEPVGQSPRDVSIPSNAHGSRQPEALPSAAKKVAGPPAGSKEPPRQLEKIIEGTATVRKKPWWKRAARSMIAEDATSVGDYMLTDIIVPAVKNLIADLVQSSTNRVLFGSTRRGRGLGGIRGETIGSSVRTRYDRMAEEPRGGRSLTREQRARHDFDEITVDHREEAIAAIEAMAEYIEEYGAVSVAHLYTLMGVTGSYADQRWGWTDLSTADVKQDRGGWLLDLPQPEPLR